MPRLARYVSLTLLLGCSWLVLAADQPKPDSKSPEPKADNKPVELKIWVIRATTKSKDVSPELKSFTEKLKGFKYTGFKLEKKLDGKAEIGKTFTTPLITGYQASVTPKNREKDKDIARIALHLEVQKEKEKKPRLSTDFKVEADVFQPFGGWELGDGDVLIIFLSAK
jgi:hypothetical protein